MFVELIAFLGATSLIVKAARMIAEHSQSRDIPVREVQAEEPVYEYEEEDEFNVDRQHINPPWECWCNADLVLEAGDGILAVWVHHGPGDELASPHEIIEAVNRAIMGTPD